MMADVAYYLPGSGNRPYKSVLTVLITVFAGAVWSLYLFADWILRQLDPNTADEIWLNIWANKLGVPRKSATFATGTVTLTGSGDVPMGTILQSSDQRRYSTTGTGAAGDAIPITAVVAGHSGNIPTPTTLTLVNPIAGVQLAGMSSVITGGIDQESLAAWANRIDEQIQQKQQIGDADDYARWAKQSHAAIEEAWAYGNTPHLGDITIYCLIAVGADPLTVLREADATLARTANVCGNRILRTPETLPIPVRIAGVSAATVRAAITTDITALFAEKRTRGAVLYPEEIERIIANHTNDFVLLAPTRRTAAAATEILQLAGVTYE